MMKISMLKFFLIVGLVFSNIFARTFKIREIKKVGKEDKKEVILVNSIPKCGTHLIKKCVNLLTGREGEWIGSKESSKYKNMNITGKDITIIQDKIKQLPENSFLCSHLTYASEFDKLAQCKNYKIIFIYRDPRSQVASFAAWQLRFTKNSEKHLNQKILSLIKDEGPYKAFWKGIRGVTGLYRAYMPWIFSKNVLIVRFEDLVGPLGGGDYERQYQVVGNIAEYLGLKKSKKDIEVVCNELFGDTWSFNKGQINGWQDCFNEEHKKVFKKYAGDLLVKLEYEIDSNW